jgi:hypothetical protein
MRSKTIVYIFCLAGFELFLGTFRFVTHGLARTALLALVMLLLVTLRATRSWRVDDDASSSHWRRLTVGLIAVAATWNVSMIGVSVAHTLKTGDIRLDQGQSTYRAALELRKGRNPYGQGALLDVDAYRSRMARRIAAGVGPTIPASAVEAELARYWQTLDPLAREKLLPSVPPNGSESARREVSILGYRYGPVPPLITAVLTPILGPAAVPVTEGAACLALFLVIALILDGAGIGGLAGGLALFAVMIDPWITFSFILSSASDVWPLLFGFAAVLCAQRRWPGTAGLCLALALGSKIFPAILYLPLLIAMRSTRAALAFGSAMAVLFLPWIIRDAHALFYNFAWPFLLGNDTTSWEHFAPTRIVAPIRATLAAVVAFVASLLILGRERRWAWALATINVAVLAGGAVFHNNYVPWFSTWVVMAIAEAFYSPNLGLLPGFDARNTIRKFVGQQDLGAA